MEMKRDGTPGSRDVFRVEIMRQRHNSWQGRLYWANEDKSSNFRSALELMLLINSAVDTRRESSHRDFYGSDDDADLCARLDSIIEEMAAAPDVAI